MVRELSAEYMTVHLAYKVRDTKIKVNFANPGFTKADLNSSTQLTKGLGVDAFHWPLWWVVLKRVLLLSFP